MDLSIQIEAKLSDIECALENAKSTNITNDIDGIYVYSISRDVTRLSSSKRWPTEKPTKCKRLNRREINMFMLLDGRRCSYITFHSMQYMSRALCTLCVVSAFGVENRQ